MYKLDAKEIVKNAIDGLTYSKAYELFSSNKVTLSCRVNELDQDVYEGVVTGKSNKSYPVTAIIDRDGKVVSATCKCDYYLSYVGYCKHILAFLLKINEITNKKETNVLTSLLQYYKKNVSLNISIVPIFYSHQYETGIELKIGKDNKYYFIKNIPELYDNIANNYYFKYGKGLEFMHSKSAFDNKSKALLEDLSDYVRFYDANSKSYFDGKRKCKLPIIVFKKVLDMFIDDKIEFVFNDAHYDLFYTSENLEIELIFENNTLHIVDREKIKLFSIGRNHFVIKDDKLYCINNSMSQDLIPLLQTLYIKPIEFNKRLFNEFFAYIYPKIKDLVTIQNREEFEKENNCSILETNCYLDLVEGCLILKYDFIYEGLEREKAIAQGIFPNIAMEENFSEQLQYFSFIKTVNRNEYVIEDTDEALNFILFELDTLKEISTVYISDTIKNLKPIKTSGTPIGVRYKNNWLEMFFNTKFFKEEEIQDILSSLSKKKHFHLLKDGTILNLQEKFFQDLEESLDNVNVKKEIVEQNKNSVQLPIFKILQIEHFLDLKDMPEEVIDFLHNLRNFKFINYPIDANLSKVLRDYQKEGVRWLMNLAYYHLSGVLADDMGLGKTLEIISLIKSCKTQRPNIIVAPASLTYNWFNEFKKWTPNLNVALITGNAHAREKIISQIKQGQTIITSYDYLKRDLPLYEKIKFHFMIVDEAQAIKNYQTKNSESVKMINAISHFALTGTPIENSLADLWSIFDYCLPGYLKSYEVFKNDYEVEIVRNQNNAMLERLNRQIAPFILRRTKSEVLRELPPKFEQILYVQMSEEQEMVYNATLNQAREKIIQTKGENKMYIFSMLTRLRQICCHPRLYLQDYSGDSAKGNLIKEVIYDAIHANHRVLIFSQFTSMLDILDESLKHYGISRFKLTGSTPTEERLKLVDEFNANPNIKVFLISLKAGGTGLNLVGADTVIHYDPWWNISAENQASDRVHRIGQKNNVQIIKMITKDSIEEKILNLQLQKKDLLDKVVSEETNLLTKLTNEELLSLFNIELKD